MTAATATLVWLFGVTLASGWLISATARADAELVLTWNAPAGCPDVAWATARTAAQLGRPLAANTTATLKADVQIEPRDEAFRLTLRTLRADAAGERIVEDARCAELAEAATLMIALALEEQAAALDTEAKPAISADVARPPATDAEKPPSLRPTRIAPAGRWPDRGLSARVGLIADAGFLPALGAGPELMLGFARPRMLAELGGFWLPARASPGAERVGVSLWAFALHVCPRAARPRFRLGACLGPELGQVSAEGAGLSENLHKRSLFASLTGSLHVRVRLGGPVWVAIEPGLSIPLLRQRFVTLDTTDQTRTVLHTPRSVSARGSVGVELSF